MGFRGGGKLPPPPAGIGLKSQTPKNISQKFSFLTPFKKKIDNFLHVFFRLT